MMVPGTQPTLEKYQHNEIMDGWVGRWVDG